MDDVLKEQFWKEEDQETCVGVSGINRCLCAGMTEAMSAGTDDLG